MSAAIAMVARSTPLSEHALANAFDVSEFVLANGTRITVLDDWPKVVETPPAPEANPKRVSNANENGEAQKPEGIRKGERRRHQDKRRHRRKGRA